MMYPVKVRIGREAVTVRSDVVEVTYLRHVQSGEWLEGIDAQRLYAALDWCRIDPFTAPVPAETIPIAVVDVPDPEDVDDRN